MSILTSAIYRPFVLWLHLGVGPLIGGGPMQARPAGQARLSAGPVANRHRRPEHDETSRAHQLSPVATLHDERREMTARDGALFRDEPQIARRGFRAT